ncbi:MAG: hypothetical protein ACD_15C00047G0008 [uncultured bacterium]|nr:MAG: hypothetical protein ACD_15C00047G0008 [uncultured bacterium]
MNKPSTKARLEPYQILYRQVLYEPENIWFHIGELTSVKPPGFMSFARFIFNLIFRIKDNGKIETVVHGGEMLTRCKIMPNCHIGKSFSDMPHDMMQEMFPVLLERQLKFIAELNVSNNRMCYSINLEAMNNNIFAWERVCSLLRQYGSRYVIVEIKEDQHLCLEVIRLLAQTCKETHIKIYLDDLCKCVHELPQEEEYVGILVEELAPYIKAVKIDYLTMLKIESIEKRDLVQKHLEDFYWIWIGKTTLKLPAVIFESTPRNDKHWLGILRELARRFSGCQYQNG